MHYFIFTCTSLGVPLEHSSWYSVTPLDHTSILAASLNMLSSSMFSSSISGHWNIGVHWVIGKRLLELFADNKFGFISFTWSSSSSSSLLFLLLLLAASPPAKYFCSLNEPSSAEMLKSQILSTSSQVTRRFPGFMSLWIMPREWRYSRPSISCRK